MIYPHISTQNAGDLRCSSNLVMHQNAPLALTILQDPSRELLAEPPPRRETYGSSSSIWIQVCKANGLGRGKVHLEAILPFLAKPQHLRALGIIGLATRFPCVAQLVICEAIIT